MQDLAKICDECEHKAGEGDTREGCLKYEDKHYCPKLKAALYEYDVRQKF